MTEFESYNHGRPGEQKIISNYTGEIEISNAFVEDSFNDLLREAKDGRSSMDNQRVLALIIEEFGTDIIEAARDADPDEIRDFHIRAIEERRAQPEPTDILEELQQEHSDKSVAELQAAREAFEEKLDNVDVAEENTHEDAVNRGED